MRIVSNASPLIFLAKCGLLPVLPALLNGEILVPDLVRDEVLAAPITPAERAVLEAFLAGCRTVTATAAGDTPTALSAADTAVVSVAHAERADLVLADDLLLRQLAAAEGLQVLGTLGVIVKSTDVQSLTPGQAREALNQLVTVHGFRISVALYARVLAEIADRA